MKRVENIVLLHGWGCDARHWRPLADALSLPVTALELPGFGGNSTQPWPSDEILLHQLYGKLPHNCLLLGHSLGGMLAARLAALPGQGKTGAEKIVALITIAANASFVQRGEWPGMAPQAFAQFRRSMKVQPETTREKFCGLQARGDKSMRILLKQLKQWRPEFIGDAWLDALDCLGRLDNRALLAELKIPALHLFGEKDALVPPTAAEKIRELGASAEILPGCGHAPQISNPHLVVEKIAPFIGDRAPLVPGSRSPVPKSAVARSFTRAAASYDAAAHLQRAVCRQLLNDLDGVPAPGRILDLGSGTGYGSELLRRRFPRAQIIALDLAEGMLHYARGHRPAADFHIAADAERLPLADGSVDLVFSSMALQWCYRLPQLFAELKRVLGDGGRCLVATLGPGTLRELKDNWAKVDGGVHVNRFMDAEVWQQAAEENALPGEMRTEERVLHYDSVLLLMRELKNIGAHNINRDADRGLTTRAKLCRLAGAYEPLRTTAGLPASYEMIYLNLARDAGETVGLSPGNAELGSARRQLRTRAAGPPRGD